MLDRQSEPAITDTAVAMRHAPTKDRAARYRLSHFWHLRNVGNPVLLDQFSVHYLSFAVAWLAHLAKLSPNKVSVLSGLFALVAFAAAMWLPTSEFMPSLLWIFLLGQIAYLLDCVDGQLARATGQESEFGASLDKGIDIAGTVFVFGGLFAYLYRHFIAVGATGSAELALVIGFLFLLARTSRFFAWQNFVHVYGARETRDQENPSLTHQIVVSMMDHQLSLFGIILFIFVPFLGFLLFAGQTALLATAYVRYFIRAWRIEQTPARGKPRVSKMRRAA